MKVAGLAGRKSAGKSTAAEGFPPDWARINFADPFKCMLIETGILTSEQAYGGEKETPLGWLDGVTPRRIMQAFGTEVGRHVHPALWARLWMRDAGIALDFGSGVVAADVRFPNEIEAVRRLGGVVIWIERPGLDATDGHASETSIGPEDCDLVVLNHGDGESLRSRVRAAIGYTPGGDDA